MSTWTYSSVIPESTIFVKKVYEEYSEDVLPGRPNSYFK